MTSKRGSVLAGLLISGVAFAPVAAQAGGVRVPAAPVLKAQSPFRPASAFGSPGGFPFMSVQDHRGLVPRVVPRRMVRPVFPAFPATSFLYAPLAPYAPLSETPPPSVSVNPVVYVSPTVYVSVPVSAAVPAPVVAPPALPLAPSVVEYTTGRYELRGDGTSTPYAWVWIPNAPAPPPEASPATSSSASSRQVYRWTDDQGTEFWTNHLERIPEPYRSRVAGQGQLAAQQ
jgi:hypothetical protein